MDAKLATLAALAILVCGSSSVASIRRTAVEHLIPSPLERLKQSVTDMSFVNPNLFNPDDLQSFLDEKGALGATRFLNQRSQNCRRASKLALSVLKWRKAMFLSEMNADSFPCDLFEMGLIFESGHSHDQKVSGEYTETNPVIWIRLGAVGSIVKKLEEFTPNRMISAAYYAPKVAWRKIQDSVSHRRQRHLRVSRFERRQARRAAKQSVVKNFSARENESLTHVLRAIAWWLDDWIKRHPSNAKATLVLDFENSDFAFASWSVGEFFVRLDDRFPDLFDQIIGFRYKARVWSLHSPISMLNRIFKSRFSSSPETDRKMRFVDDEPKMGAFMPRVDASGFTLLPEHVSGACLAPDKSKAPAGCDDSGLDANSGSHLYDPNFWQKIYNEFYNTCKPKSRHV